MDKRKILIQLDSDSAAERLRPRRGHRRRRGRGVQLRRRQAGDRCSELVHGAIFTRGPKDLNRTAIFIGGSDVAAGEKLLAEVQQAHDPAVRPARVGAARRQRRQHDGRRRRAAGRPAPGSETRRRRWSWAAPAPSASVWPCCWRGKGPRSALGSRQQRPGRRSRSRRFRPSVPGARLEPVGIATAGRPARPRWPGERWSSPPGPPASCCCRRPPGRRVRRCASPSTSTPCRRWASRASRSTDKGKERDGVIGYGALGVGDTKMKVHRAAVARLFESNDQVLDAEQVYALARAF